MAPNLVAGLEHFLRSKEYFMAAAILASQCSPDPDRQVGACLVKNSEIIGIGYNKFPDGFENQFSWAGSGEAPSLIHNKHGYVLHAELNAISSAPSEKLNGSELYTTLVPCHECAKLIVRCGIAKIYYLTDRTDETFMVGKNMLRKVGIPLNPYDGKMAPIEINFSRFFTGSQ